MKKLLGFLFSIFSLIALIIIYPFLLLSTKRRRSCLNLANNSSDLIISSILTPEISTAQSKKIYNKLRIILFHIFLYDNNSFAIIIPISNFKRLIQNKLKQEITMADKVLLLDGSGAKLSDYDRPETQP